MEIGKISNNTFGITLSPNACMNYAKILGAPRTHEIMSKVANIGNTNTLVTDISEISLLHKYGVSKHVNKAIEDLTSTEVQGIEESLLHAAMTKAAKDGNLIKVNSELQKDYSDFKDTIKKIFFNCNLQEADSKVDTFRMHHPILYKMGFRPKVNL